MATKTENIELEQLKREVSLLSLAAALNPKKLGNGEYVVLCPFHYDKNPSLHINSAKNLFHCKGCGKSGSVIDWVMLTQNIELPDAIRTLRGEQRNGHSHPAATRNEAENINILEPRYQQAFKCAVDFWHNNFKHKKEGVEYLVRRGLVYGELVDTFRVGYADGSLTESINDKAMLVALEELGIIAGGREHFGGRVIFPVCDEDGNVTQLYGRNTGREGVKHLYMKAPLTGLYNPHGIASETILAESIIDALSLMALGHRNVVASYGVNGLKNDVLEMLAEKKVRRIYIAYDPDSTGDTAAAALAEKFITHKIESYRIAFPADSDANDYLRKIPDAKEQFKKLIETATPLKRLTDEALAESERSESLEKKGNEYRYRVGPRFYTIRGIENNKNDSQLKIFLRLDSEDSFHIDNNLDLFNARTTGAFVKSAALRLSIDERVIRADLDRLTNGLDEILKKAIEERESRKNPAKIEFHRDLALSLRAREFLTDPLFLIRFVSDVEKCGLVGESLNFFFSFLCTHSRHMNHQLHVIIQSESSAGKSTMLNLLAEFVPEEECTYFTQVTPRSLYYGPPGFLKNKSIFIAEADGLKEAEFPIKQLMSEGKLAISYTKTDPDSGEHTAEVKENEGPVQFAITEPQERLHEEIENRSVVLNLDVTPEQTERIQELQRLLHSGDGVRLKKQKAELTDFYRHVQREIKIYPVINPYTHHLKYNTENHQTRRDHQKYLTVMNAITSLFQYQREKVMKDGQLCLVSHLIDIALTHFLIRRVFAKSLDELPSQTRNFIRKLTEHYQKFAKERELDFDQVWFYRKEMRQITGLSNTRVHEHTSRLVDFEYLTSRRDQNGIAYRFLITPDSGGHYRGILKLAAMSELLKKAPKKERQEYRAFIPSLEKIFRALDPLYAGGET